MKEANSEIECLNAICNEARRKGKLEDEQIVILKRIFGSRFLNAWKAVNERRVKRYIFKPSGCLLYTSDAADE